jgi:hypothetical protein
LALRLIYFLKNLSYKKLYDSTDDLYEQSEKTNKRYEQSEKTNKRLKNVLLEKDLEINKLNQTNVALNLAEVELKWIQNNAKFAQEELEKENTSLLSRLNQAAAIYKNKQDELMIAEKGSCEIQQEVFDLKSKVYRLEREIQRALGGLGIIFHVDKDRTGKTPQQKSEDPFASTELRENIFKSLTFFGCFFENGQSQDISKTQIDSFEELVNAKILHGEALEKYRQFITQEEIDKPLVETVKEETPSRQKRGII